MKIVAKCKILKEWSKHVKKNSFLYGHMVTSMREASVFWSWLLFSCLGAAQPVLLGALFREKGLPQPSPSSGVSLKINGVKCFVFELFP